MPRHTRRNVPEPLLTPRQAAEILGVSLAFLARDRWTNARIPFVRVGPHSIRYRPADLESFIEANSARPAGGLSDLGRPTLNRSSRQRGG